MAISNFQHAMSGPAVVYWDVDGAGNAEAIGINRGEIPYTVQQRFIDVPTDQFGGPEGVPADAQFLGAIVTVQLELTRYDLAVLERLLRLVPLQNSGLGYGSFPPIGTFVRQQGMARRLLFVTPSETRALAVSFVRNPMQLNISSRYRTYSIAFESWMGYDQGNASVDTNVWLHRDATDESTLPVSGAPFHTNVSNTPLATS